MTAYYNEIDPKAAAWLRELIKQGHIAQGDVDETDIRDVDPDRLDRYTQCHFFAGIGGWSLALRLAGWPDDRPVWTGSCPCQPFSAAGRRAGQADERHLWPHWHHLISQCQPATIFGEQVASKDGLGWLDLVSADMEATGYAFAAQDICAAGLGAPHIRQRLWFVGMADADSQHLLGGSGQGNGAAGKAEGEAREWQRGWDDDCAGGANGGMADADSWQRLRVTDGEGRERDGAQTGRQQGDGELESGGELFGLADAADAGFQIRRGRSSVEPGSVEQSERLCADGGLADAGSGRSKARIPKPNERQEGQPRKHDDSGDQPAGRKATFATTRASTVDSHWRDADWLFCRDGKWRPVEPGTFPLAHGLPARVGRLRGYGNAIVPQVAAAWIEAVMEYDEVKT